MKNLHYVFIILISGSTFANDGPSFDCSLAGNSIEKNICDSPHISALDLELNNLYEAFIRQADEGVKLKAKRMQRNWLVNRGKACSDQSAIFFEDGIPEDFKNVLFNDQTNCLEVFYNDSIEAFNKGLILSKFWLYGERDSASIKVPSMEGVTLEFNKTDSDYEDEFNGSWVIKSQSGSIQLSEVVAVTGMSGWQSEPVFFNHYMDVNGNTFASLVSMKATSGTRADCFYRHSYSLSFIDSLINLTRPVVVERKVRSYYSDCERTDEILDWRFEDAELIFTKKIDLLKEARSFTKSRFFKYSLLKIEGHKLIEYEDLGFELASSTNKSIEEIVESQSDEMYVKEADNQCQTIKTGLSLAFNLYFQKDVRNTSMLYWIEKAKDFQNIDKYKDTSLYQTALIFKKYLETIKAHENWAASLSQAGRLYEYNVYSGLVKRSYKSAEFDHPFLEVGFPSLLPCPAYRSVLRYPDTSLDEQIYGFWNRRLEDGSLPYFSRLLDLID